MRTFYNLRFTDDFIESFASRRFGSTERAAILKALASLDSGETTSGLRVHQLRGDLAGSWSASASRSIRIAFTRETDGTLVIEDCTRHYDS